MKKRPGRPRLSQSPNAVAQRQRAKYKDGRVCPDCREKKPIKDFDCLATGYFLPKCKPCEHAHSVYRQRVRRYRGKNGLARLDERITQLRRSLSEYLRIREELYVNET